MLKEIAKSGKNGAPNVKAKPCPEAINEAENINPQKDPKTANELPHLLAKESFFLNNKEPKAPSAKHENKIKKLICDVIIPSILF